MYRPLAHHPHRMAAGLASLGRGGDSMLVHMSPSEVAGLQKLALAHGGSLSVNPNTGLPEAKNLKDYLPSIAAAFLPSAVGDFISSETGWGDTASSLATGAIIGGLTGDVNAGIAAYQGAKGYLDVSQATDAIAQQKAAEADVAKLTAAQAAQGSTVGSPSSDLFGGTTETRSPLSYSSPIEAMNNAPAGAVTFGSDPDSPWTYNKYLDSAGKPISLSSTLDYSDEGNTSENLRDMLNKAAASSTSVSPDTADKPRKNYFDRLSTIAKNIDKLTPDQQRSANQALMPFMYEMAKSGQLGPSSAVPSGIAAAAPTKYYVPAAGQTSTFNPGTVNPLIKQLGYLPAGQPYYINRGFVPGTFTTTPPVPVVGAKEGGLMSFVRGGKVKHYKAGTEVGKSDSSSSETGDSAADQITGNINDLTSGFGGQGTGAGAGSDLDQITVMGNQVLGGNLGNTGLEQGGSYNERPVDIYGNPITVDPDNPGISYSDASMQTMIQNFVSKHPTLTKVINVLGAASNPYLAAAALGGLTLKDLALNLGKVADRLGVSSKVGDWISELGSSTSASGQGTTGNITAPTGPVGSEVGTAVQNLVNNTVGAGTGAVTSTGDNLITGNDGGIGGVGGVPVDSTGGTKTTGGTGTTTTGGTGGTETTGGFGFQYPTFQPPPTAPSVSSFAPATQGDMNQYYKQLWAGASQQPVLNAPPPSGQPLSDYINMYNTRVSLPPPVGKAEGGSIGEGLGSFYKAGGKLLRGPGDGMSDSIPAVIHGKNPQRAALADGEFVIPADVVSHLGNGSTEAGSRKLYSMMDKIRQARTGRKAQGKQINADKYLPA